MALPNFRCLLRTDEHFIDRPRRIRAPYPLTGLHVIGCEMAADAELSTGDASQHFVLHDHWRRRAGLALRRVAVLDCPNALPGLGVERDERGVGLMQKDHAVGIANAPVNRVAA